MRNVIKKVLFIAALCSAFSMANTGYCFQNEPNGVPYKWGTMVSEIDNMKFAKKTDCSSSYFYSGDFNIGEYQFNKALLVFYKDYLANERFGAAYIGIDGEENIKAISKVLFNIYGKQGYTGYNNSGLYFYWVGENTIITFELTAANLNEAFLSFHKRKALEKMQLEGGAVSQKQLDYYSQYKDMHGGLLGNYLKEVLDKHFSKGK